MSRFGRFRGFLRLLPKALGVGVLAIIILLMSYGIHTRVGPGDSEYNRPTAGDRRIELVRPLATTQTIGAVGTVRPRRQTQVASQLLAIIQSITVNAGDSVEAGQLLATLDDREIQAQLREAEAAVSGVEADLAVRQQDYSRYKQMFAEHAVSKEDFDRVKGTFHVAEAQLQRAKQHVERMLVMLSYTRINAPESGIVSDRFSDPGDLAAPGKPLLGIHDPNELELHASVRESLAAHLQLGAKLGVKVDAAHLATEGVVREIAPQAETASRSVLVKVKLPQENLAHVYIGMFGRLEIPVGRLDRIVIVADAVQTIGQLDLVDVVRDDGTLERRYIRIGRRIGNDAEVLSGLRVGERVAVPDQRESTANARLLNNGSLATSGLNRD